MSTMTLMMLRDAGTITTRDARTAPRDGADAGDAPLPSFEEGAASDASRQLSSCAVLRRYPCRGVSAVTAVMGYMPKYCWEPYSLVLVVPPGRAGPQSPAPTISFEAPEGPVPVKLCLLILENVGCNREIARPNPRLCVTHCSLNNGSIRVGRASKGPLILQVAAPVAAKASDERASNCAAPARRDFLDRKSSVYGAL